MNKELSCTAIKYLGGLAFVVALLIHLITYLYFQIGGSLYVVMHCGIFILYILFSQLPGNKGFRTTFNNKDRDNPLYLVVKAFGVYCVLNFGICLVLLKFGAPDIWEGQFVLQNKGQLIEIITETDYYKYQSYVTRLFSGFWMLMYLNIVSQCIDFLNRFKNKNHFK